MEHLTNNLEQIIIIQLQQTKESEPISQEFYYVYDQYKNVTKPSGWNGVVPSGAWVRARKAGPQNLALALMEK